ncbi:MBL fold metallo-hydrolase [Candidatus Microgenomates bacterium]|nr:MBL fold metallo-hydrolase [Candidatus Microgenomates bacterium]
MDILYLGHSSFRIKGRTQTLVTDPFNSSIGIKFPKIEADVVTLSHDHDDHNNVAAVSGIKKVFSRPGEYEVNGVSIFGIASYHDDKKGEERGENVIYLYEMDGIKIAHLGDLGHTLTESQIDQLGTVDILMIPVGGVYTIGPTEAVSVVQAIEPKIIIPMHYKTNDLNQETFGKLEPVETFVSALGVKSETLPKLSYKLGDLPEGEQRVYILETK